MSVLTTRIWPTFIIITSKIPISYNTLSIQNTLSSTSTEHFLLLALTMTGRQDHLQLPSASSGSSAPRSWEQSGTQQEKQTLIQRLKDRPDYPGEKVEWGDVNVCFSAICQVLVLTAEIEAVSLTQGVVTIRPEGDNKSWDLDQDYNIVRSDNYHYYQDLSPRNVRILPASDSTGSGQEFHFHNISIYPAVRYVGYPDHTHWPPIGRPVLTQLSDWLTLKFKS